MDLLALAERARSRGRLSGTLFYWLLSERKFAFITHADENEAPDDSANTSTGSNLDSRSRGSGGVGLFDE